MNFNKTIRRNLTPPGGGLFSLLLTEYAANDVLGGTSRFNFGGDSGGLLLGIEVLDVSKQNIPLKVRFYQSQPTILANSDPMVVDVVSGLVEIGYVDLPANLYKTVPSDVYTKLYKDLDIKVDEISKGHIWVNVENEDAVTYPNATDLNIKLVMWVE